MDICCICDDSYILPLRVMLASLARNAANVTFWLLYSDIQDSNLSRVSADVHGYGWKFECVKISDNALKVCDQLPEIGRFSRKVYYRLFIPWILADCKKVLYLDCDMLVRSSLADLFAIEMKGRAIAAAPDGRASGEEHNSARLGLAGRYYNSGVLLIDCEAIRALYSEESMAALILEAEKKHRLVFPDQDLLNLVYENQFMTLNAIWNFTPNLKSGLYILTHPLEMRRIKVIHYIGPEKPWHSSYSKLLVFEYWKHLRNFLTKTERIEYWRRKRFVRSQLSRRINDVLALVHRLGTWNDLQ